MPLKYDDEDGSWGRLSQRWPAVQFESYSIAQECMPICWRDLKMASGTYVVCLGEIRCETRELRDQLYNFIFMRGGVKMMTRD